MGNGSLRFSPWTKWIDRKECKVSGRTGLYLLAHFIKVPAGKANPMAKSVIYIGQTHGESFLARWRAFDRSARGKGRGHSGGCAYMDNFTTKRIGELHVAACELACRQDRIQTARLLYLERKLIWEFARKHRSLPACNRE
jgi:hypothetical protein